MKSLFLSFTLLFCSFQLEAAKPSVPVKVVVLGDSLTEGYGLDKDQAFPALVEKKFLDRGKKVEVINAGVSGSTSAGGLSRVAWVMKSKPQFVVVALGSNDGLRGLDVSACKKNIKEIIQRVRADGATPLLIGMKVPPNYGVEYTKKFENIFLELSAEEKVPLLPFLLLGVAGQPKYNLPDAIHPNKEGHKILAETVYQFLEKNI
ncbi:MAG: arylesterase [Bdellovibrionales bacterium]